MEPGSRVYRFVLTFEVEPGHEAYTDPEWAADAAWGALTNLYGLRSIYATSRSSTRAKGSRGSGDADIV